MEKLNYGAYCLGISIALGKFAFSHDPRGWKARKDKQIGLEGMLLDNPLLKVVVFVSAAVPYRETWSLLPNVLWEWF